MKSVLWGIGFVLGSSISLSLQAADVADNTGNRVAGAIKPFDIQAEDFRSNLVVPVLINGKGPFRFYYDTGAPGSLHITESAAKEAGLVEDGVSEISDMMGNVIPVQSYASATLGFGETQFEVSDIIATTVDGMLGEDIAGVMGREVFAEGTLTLNFLNDRFSYSAQEALPVDVSMPYTLEHGHITIPLSYGSETIEAHFDSGNTVTAYGLPTKVAEKLELDKLPGETKVARTATSKIEIHLVQPEANFNVRGVELGAGKVMYPVPGPVANIGAKAVKRGIVKIDFTQQRIQFEFPEG